MTWRGLEVLCSIETCVKKLKRSVNITNKLSIFRNHEIRYIFSIMHWIVFEILVYSQINPPKKKILLRQWIILFGLQLLSIFCPFPLSEDPCQASHFLGVGRFVVRLSTNLHPWGPGIWLVDWNQAIWNICATVKLDHHPQVRLKIQKHVRNHHLGILYMDHLTSLCLVLDFRGGLNRKEWSLVPCPLGHSAIFTEHLHPYVSMWMIMHQGTLFFPWPWANQNHYPR